MISIFLFYAKIFSPATHADIYDDWVRSSITFTLLRKENTVEIYLEGIGIEANHFLIRPAAIDVYYNWRKDGSFVFNNYFIPRR
jgi:hypothetical protein